MASKRWSHGSFRGVVLTTLVLVVGVWMFAAALLAADPDGGSMPTFSGAPAGFPALAAGSAPQAGVGVFAATGEVMCDIGVARARGVEMPFGFNASYGSHSLYDGRLGFGWCSILDWNAFEMPDGNVNVLMDGRTWLFVKNGSSYVSPSGVVDVLAKNGADNFTLATPEGRSFQFTPYLSVVADRFGNSIEIGRDVSGDPQQFTDTRGQVHPIALWPNTGRLKTITMADGRVWMFKYDANANLTEIAGPATVQFPSGITLAFGYSSGSGTPALDHNMTSATDGRGDIWLQAQFDTSDRVTTQTIDSGTFVFDYAAAASSKTTVTDDPVGNESVWEWHPSSGAQTALTHRTNRNVRPSEGDYTTTWTADADGYHTSVTDPDGGGMRWTLNAVKLQLVERAKCDMTASDDDDADIVQSWTYDETKHYGMTSETDALGRTTTFALNDFGQALTTTFPTITNVIPNMTITNEHTYNANGAVATFTDGVGTVTAYEYFTSGAKKGQVQYVRDDFYGMILTTTHDYNAWGQRTSVTDPSGNKTTYIVDAYNNVTQINSPSALGYVTKIAYDGNLNVVKKEVKNVDEHGLPQTVPTAWWTTESTYSPGTNHLLSVTEFVSPTHNRITTMTYDGNGQRLTTERGGFVVEQQYDERGLIFKRIRDPGPSPHLGVTETFDYNADGGLSTSTNGRGKTTTLTYDCFGRATRRTDPLGNYEEWAYDKNGSQVEHKWWEQSGSGDVLLTHSKSFYDENGGLYREDDLLIGSPNDWLTRSYEFDERGLQTVVTDRLARVTTLEYDGMGRCIKVTDPLGNVEEWTHDASGNAVSHVVSEVVPGSSNESYVATSNFDELNRMTSRTVIDPNDGTNTKVTSWEFDSRSALKSSTDAQGSVTTSTFDGVGRRTSQSSPISTTITSTTTWAYDDNDNVTMITDDNLSQTSFTFDDIKRVTTVTYADGTTTSYVYDANDNTIQTVDANGTQVDRSYDDTDRLLGRVATLAAGVGGDTVEAFTYDGMGRLLQVTDNDSTVDFTYDSLSRTLTEHQGANPVGGTGKTVTYSYDAEGNRTSVTYPGGFTALRAYDGINRLVQIDDGSASLVAEFDLYGAGARLQKTTFGNGTVATYGHDGFRRPTSIVHKDSSNTLVAGFSYGWDKLDNPLYEARTHSAGIGEVYAYDKASRLAQVLYGCGDPPAEVATPGSQTYSTKQAHNMDGVLNLSSVVTTPSGGSPTTVSYTTNAVNEYTLVGTSSLVYFANGDLKDDGTFTYTYDCHGHLIEARRKSDGVVVGAYKYDAFGRGRRIERDAGGTVTRYVHAGGHAIEEYDDASGSLLRHFAFGDRYDEVVMVDTGTRYHIHTQLVGSVVAATGPTGTVAERYEYDAFGRTTIKDASGTTLTSTQIGNRHGFTGRQFDEETQQYHYRARQYSPGLRRFLQRDPLGSADGPNPYAYVHMRPTIEVDPSGLRGRRGLPHGIEVDATFITNVNPGLARASGGNPAHAAIRALINVGAPLGKSKGKIDKKTTWKWARFSGWMGGFEKEGESFGIRRRLRRGATSQLVFIQTVREKLVWKTQPGRWTNRGFTSWAIDDGEQTPGAPTTPTTSTFPGQDGDSEFGDRRRVGAYVMGDSPGAGAGTRQARFDALNRDFTGTAGFGDGIPNGATDVKWILAFRTYVYDMDLDRTLGYFPWAVAYTYRTTQNPNRPDGEPTSKERTYYPKKMKFKRF